MFSSCENASLARNNYFYYRFANERINENFQVTLIIDV